MSTHGSPSNFSIDESKLEQVYIEEDEVADIEELDGEGPPEADDDMEVGPNEMSGERGANQFEFVDDSVQGFFEHKEPVFDVAINPAQLTMVISGGGDDRAYIWDRASAHGDSVIAVGFSSDGRLAASGGMDGKVQVFDTATGALVGCLEGPDEVMWMQWHPKGPVLLVGANDSSIWMFQLPSGRVMNVFSGHSSVVTCGAFTPDGKHIVTGSEDATLILWDPVSAKAIWRLTGSDARFHQSAITNLSISDDSTLILTGSVDSTAKLIRVWSGEIINSLENHTDSVEAIGFCHRYYEVRDI
ncbi:60S ribosomal subunit assembly or modification protein [Massospora cicadina]|nr:60S ribosomal subunit assembly or modification protein [Massospora cicadina]